MSQRLPLRVFNAAASVAQWVWRPARFADAEGELLEAARRATGLEDFGGDSFLEGLRVLLRAYDEEARLNPFGRFLVRQQLVGVLAARLGVVATVVGDGPALPKGIPKPLFVLGLPRTGTTALHNVLARDPANQVLEYWLAAAPGPRPPRSEWSRDRRFKQAEKGLKLTYWLDPGLRAIHDLEPDGPEECRHLFMQCFTDDTYDSNATIPSYTAWYRAQDMRPSYAWHRQVLEVVGSTSPDRRWVLKYPSHLTHLEVLLETYPDACVVQTHRDPADVLPSLCSLVTNWRGIYEDRVDVEEVARWQVDMWVERMEHALSVRDRADTGRFFDLDHREIVSDPVGAAKRVYDHFGLDLGETAERRMREWQTANPPGAHGAHQYSAGDFGLDPGELSERFAFYTRRFDGC